MPDGVTIKKNGGVDTLLHTAVATLYSNLVTRPTGRAVRVAIEKQLREAPAPCLSILDFSQVGILDFSCADEIVAKLLGKYQSPERPCDAYFILRDVSEHHRDPIEAVLRRHDLLAVAVDRDQPTLWGPAPKRLHQAWRRLGTLGRAFCDDFASAEGLTVDAASSWLRRLASRRVAVLDQAGGFASLSAIARNHGVRSEALDSLRDRVAAEEAAPYRGDGSGDVGLADADAIDAHLSRRDDSALEAR